MGRDRDYATMAEDAATVVEAARLGWRGNDDTLKGINEAVKSHRQQKEQAEREARAAAEIGRIRALFSGWAARADPKYVANFRYDPENPVKPPVTVLVESEFTKKGVGAQIPEGAFQSTVYLNGDNLPKATEERPTVLDLSKRRGLAVAEVVRWESNGERVVDYYPVTWINELKPSPEDAENPFHVVAPDGGVYPVRFMKQEFPIGFFIRDGAPLPNQRFQRCLLAYLVKRGDPKKFDGKEFSRFRAKFMADKHQDVKGREDKVRMIRDMSFLDKVPKSLLVNRVKLGEMLMTENPRERVVISTMLAILDKGKEAVGMISEAPSTDFVELQFMGGDWIRQDLNTAATIADKWEPGEYEKLCTALLHKMGNEYLGWALKMKDLLISEPQIQLDYFRETWKDTGGGRGKDTVRGIIPLLSGRARPLPEILSRHEQSKPGPLWPEAGRALVGSFLAVENRIRRYSIFKYPETVVAGVLLPQGADEPDRGVYYSNYNPNIGEDDEVPKRTDFVFFRTGMVNRGRDFGHGGMSFRIKWMDVAVGINVTEEQVAQLKLVRERIEQQEIEKGGV